MIAGESAASVPIGILALQGDFDAHRKMLEELLGVPAVLVRTSDDLKRVGGLILPGGESTTIGKLLQRYGLEETVRERAAEGMPIYGTCAGLILLAREIEESEQFRLGLLDVTVARNAFGRQVDSFEADIALPVVGDEPVRGVFIRAPYVTRIGPDVEVLGRFENKIVAVRQGNVLASAFHPELTQDTRVHVYFVEMVRDNAARS